MPRFGIDVSMQTIIRTTSFSNGMLKIELFFKNVF